MWKLIIPTTMLMMMLSACASVDVAKKAIANKAAQASATALLDAEWWVCRAASVGSVKDRYGQSVERSMLYKNFCDGSGEANVVGP